MFVNFNESARNILKNAEKEKDLLNHPYVGSEHLVLSILSDNKLKSIFKKYNVTYDLFKNKLIKVVGVGSKKSEFTLYTPLLKRIIENSVIEARESKVKYITPEILLISLFNEEDGVAYSIFKLLNVNIEKIYFDIRKNKRGDLKSKKSILKDLGSDLTLLAKQKKLDPVIGRNDEINKTIEILLRRKKNNPILIGPAGVGKTAIVEGIANLIVSKKCPTFLKNKKIISLNMFSVVSGTKYRGEFEEKMKQIIKELEENDNIILFIDEVHTIVGAGGAEGAIDASNIFKPALARGLIKIIGATTLDEYKKFIEPDSALSRRFQNIYIKEPSYENVIDILMKTKKIYEKYHNIKIDNDRVYDIANLSKKYLSNRFEPDRSIDILDEVSAKVSISENNNDKKKIKLKNRLYNIKSKRIKALSKKDFDGAYKYKVIENNIGKLLNKNNTETKYVTKKDILDVIRAKENIIINEYSVKRKKYYNDMLNDLKQKIYGQNDNIEKLVKFLEKREIVQNNKCHSILVSGKNSKKFFINSFLKYITDDKSIIKIDGNDYSEYHTISKLIGSTAGYIGYDNKNNVFERIRNNPSSIIIIENYDNTCIEFRNIFSKILRDSYIEDSKNVKIDFSKCIIIFCEYKNTKKVGFNSKANDSEINNNYSLVLTMNELDEDDIKSIIKNKITELLSKYSMIKVSYDSNILDLLYRKVKNNLSKIDYYIEKYIEIDIINAIYNSKREINIKEKV